MKLAWLIARYEIKLGFRNPWAYSFLVLFSVFALAVLLIQSNNFMGLSGYTHATATMMNLIFYLLPLMTLLLGSFSLTSEKEDGSWRLMSTYAVSSAAYMIGKFAGLMVVILAILTVGFGLFGLVGGLLAQTVTLSVLGTFLGFSTALLGLYLAWALLVGTLAQSRWQALTVSVGFWFLTVLAWPTLLIAGLNFLPYTLIQPTLTVLTCFNPAEMVRLATVLAMGAGAVFGPAYYQWVQVEKGFLGLLVLTGVGILWMAIILSAAIFLWERGRNRD